MAVSPHHGNSTSLPAPQTGAVAVGRFIAPIAGKTLSRGGTVMAGLIAQWPGIAGPSLAAHTMPAKLTKSPPDPASAGTNGPSVLLLKVDPAKALEVQYAVPQLIERINQALGYKAVAALRVVQTPIQVRPKSPPRQRAAAAEAGKEQNATRLASALERMAQGMKSRSGA